jgi:hypothetical protein
MMGSRSYNYNSTRLRTIPTLFSLLKSLYLQESWNRAVILKFFRLQSWMIRPAGFFPFFPEAQAE